jgi:hypothetical protein
LSWSSVALGEESPAAKPSADGFATPTLRLAAGPGLVVRNLRYTQPIADASNAALVPHENEGLFAPALQAVWYPGASASNAPHPHVGLGLGFQHSIGGNTSAYGQNFDTTYQQLLLDVRLEIPLQVHALSVFAGWSQQRLFLSGDNEVPAGGSLPDAGIIPDVRYDALRIGGSAALVLAPGLRVEPELGLRRPRLGGEVGEFAEQRWFPNASAWGFESSVRLTTALDRTMSAFLAVDYLRYGIQMGSKPSSALAAGSSTQLAQSVAGGATDQYLSLVMGLELRLGAGSRPQ